MKRLIKKAVLSDIVNIYGEQCSVYKNPSNKEIQKIFNECNVIRGVILENNDMYVWDGTIWHDIMKSHSIIDVNQFRFAYDNNIGWHFNPHDTYTAEQMKNMIVKYEGQLSKIGNLNTNIDIVHEKFNNIQELKESMNGGN